MAFFTRVHSPWQQDCIIFVPQIFSIEPGQYLLTHPLNKVSERKEGRQEDKQKEGRRGQLLASCAGNPSWSAAHSLDDVTGLLSNAAQVGELKHTNVSQNVIVFTSTFHLLQHVVLVEEYEENPTIYTYVAEKEKHLLNSWKSLIDHHESLDHIVRTSSLE